MEIKQLNDKNECKFFDIGKKFFGIPVDNDKMERIGCEEMRCDMQNELIDRIEAIDVIKRLNLENKGELWCSINAVKGKNVKDYLGRSILQSEYDEISGWIFLLDCQPYANWSHDCEYYFVYAKDMYYHCCSQYGLYISIKMEKLQ